MQNVSIVDEIAGEHDFLKAELGRYKALVSVLDCEISNGCPCDSHNRSICHSLHDAFAESLMSDMQKHFAHEEVFMRGDFPSEVKDAFEAHKEDHADMTEKVARALGANSVSEQHAKILDLITGWMTVHIEMHDQLLINWIRNTQSS